MLSRFRGPIPNTWFCVDLRVPLRALRVLGAAALFRDARLGIFDTYWGLLLPHVAVHICFFSWIMKGFFDGIDPSMEYAAMIDGCSRWGAFLARGHAVGDSRPDRARDSVLALYLERVPVRAHPDGHETPILTVVMAQFVHELGMEWHLMSATAVIALGPALIVTCSARRYVIRGLEDLSHGRSRR